MDVAEPWLASGEGIDDAWVKLAAALSADFLGRLGPGIDTPHDLLPPSDHKTIADLQPLVARKVAGRDDLLARRNSYRY